MRKLSLCILVVVIAMTSSTVWAEDDPVNAVLGLFGLQIKQQQPAQQQGEPQQQQQVAAQTNAPTAEEKKTIWEKTMDGTVDDSKYVPSGPLEGLSSDKKRVILYIDTGAYARPRFEERNEVSLPVRYVDNGDGSLRDTMIEGLFWMKDTNCLGHNYPELDNDKESLTDQTYRDGRVTIKTARAFVSGINKKKYPRCHFGHADWRLPTRDEIDTLVQMDEKAIRVKTALQGGIGHPLGQVNQYFTKWLHYQGFDVLPTGGAYWTSNGWNYNLSNLEPKTTPFVTDNTIAYVWLVRGKAK